MAHTNLYGVWDEEVKPHAAGEAEDQLSVVGCPHLEKKMQQGHARV